MLLALGQMDVAWLDRAANLDRIGRIAQEAAGAGAGVLILPEMCTTGFSMDAGAAAEDVDALVLPEPPGETGAVLATHARAHGIALIAGVALRVKHEPMGRNVALAIDARGALRAAYTKLHPFTYAGEHEHYLPGEGAQTFAMGPVQVAPFICYDLRFPEVFRAVAPEVELIAVIANWPASRARHWRALLQARAIENQCYVAGVNRVGTDGAGIAYAGGSVVFGPMGEVVAEMGGEAGVGLAEIDPAEVARVREKFPFLGDRRF
jgi:predicted amidohydrolase